MSDPKPLTPEEEVVWRQGLSEIEPYLGDVIAKSAVEATMREWADRLRRAFASLDAARARPDALVEAAQAVDAVQANVRLRLLRNATDATYGSLAVAEMVGAACNEVRAALAAKEPTDG